jgi:hypothetical protein
MSKGYSMVGGDAPSSQGLLWNRVVQQSFAGTVAASMEGNPIYLTGDYASGAYQLTEATALLFLTIMIVQR